MKNYLGKNVSSLNYREMNFTAQSESPLKWTKTYTVSRFMENEYLIG